MENQKMEGDTPKLLLKPAEVQAVTGYGRSTVYKMIATGEIKSIKHGKTIRVPIDSLRHWIASHLQAPNEKDRY